MFYCAKVLCTKLCSTITGYQWYLCSSKRLNYWYLKLPDTDSPANR